MGNSCCPISDARAKRERRGSNIKRLPRKDDKKPITRQISSNISNDTPKQHRTQNLEARRDDSFKNQQDEISRQDSKRHTNEIPNYLENSKRHTNEISHYSPESSKQRTNDQISKMNENSNHDINEFRNIAEIQIHPSRTPILQSRSKKQDDDITPIHYDSLEHLLEIAENEIHRIDQFWGPYEQIPAIIKQVYHIFTELDRQQDSDPSLGTKIVETKDSLNSALRILEGRGMILESNEQTSDEERKSVSTPTVESEIKRIAAEAEYIYIQINLMDTISRGHKIVFENQLIKCQTDLDALDIEAGDEDQRNARRNVLAICNDAITELNK